MFSPLNPFSSLIINSLQEHSFAKQASEKRYRYNIQDMADEIIIR